MKYLSDYTEEAKTELFERLGVFFAFSNMQLQEGCKKVGASKDNKVAHVGAGCYVLSKNVDELLSGLDSLTQAGIKMDIEENGIEAIIHRELGNYEYCFTYDLSDTVRALAGYGITTEQIQAQTKSYLASCNF